MKKLLYVLLFALVSSISYAIDITDCQEINQSGTYYLVNDILDSNGNPETLICMDIIAVSDVILDCQGHLIDSDGSGYTAIAIGIDTSNITIQNCNISDWQYGIEASGIKIKIDNATITSSFQYGIDVSGSNVTINSSIINSANIGIYIESSANNVTIKDSTINGSFDKNIYIYHNNGPNYIYNNQIINGPAGGVLIDNSNNSIFYNNTFNNSINIDFIGNCTNQFNSSIGNKWYTSDGNGYSEILNCSDSNDDRICDNPYTLNSQNVDYFPIAKTIGQNKLPRSIFFQAISYAVEPNAWGWPEGLVNGNQTHIKFYLVIETNGTNYIGRTIHKINITKYVSSPNIIQIINSTNGNPSYTFSDGVLEFSEYIANKTITSKVGLNSSDYISLTTSDALVGYNYYFSNVTNGAELPIYVTVKLPNSMKFYKQYYHPRYWVCLLNPKSDGSCSEWSPSVDVTHANERSNCVPSTTICPDMIANWNETLGRVDRLTFKAIFRSPFLIQVAITLGAYQSSPSSPTTGGGSGGGIWTTTTISPENMTLTCPPGYVMVWSNEKNAYVCKPYTIPPIQRLEQFLTQPLHPKIPFLNPITLFFIGVITLYFQKNHKLYKVRR